MPQVSSAVGDVLACSLARPSHHLGPSSPMHPMPPREDLCDFGVALDDAQGSLPIPTTLHDQHPSVPATHLGAPLALQPLPALSIQAR